MPHLELPAGRGHLMLFAQKSKHSYACMGANTSKSSADEQSPAPEGVKGGLLSQTGHEGPIYSLCALGPDSLLSGGADEVCFF